MLKMNILTFWFFFLEGVRGRMGAEVHAFY